MHDIYLTDKISADLGKNYVIFYRSDGYIFPIKRSYTLVKFQVTFAGGVAAGLGHAGDVIYRALLAGPKPGPVTALPSPHPRYKDCFFDQATKREATEVLQDKVRCAASEEENVDELKKKKTKADDDNNNVSLVTVYEEILHENHTKELNQSQTDQQVIHLLFK